MSESRPQAASGTLVAIAMISMSVITYGFTIVAARVLVPTEFGALTALLSIILIANVVSLGLQASVARRLAVSTAHPGVIIATTARVAWIIALAVGGGVAIASVAFTPLLHLDSVWPVMLAGAMMVPLTVMGAQAGIAQGSGQWRRLTGIYLGNGVGRLVGGTLGMVLEPSATGAMIGLAAGAWLPVFAGLGLMRTSNVNQAESRRPLVRESLVSSLTLFAYFTLSNVDALLGRGLFAGHDSGLYAAGLIITKSTLFLPQFVSVVFFPHLARDSSHRSRLLALGFVTGLGATAVLVVALLPELALILVGGDAYRQIAEQLWLFALSGTVLAIVYVLVFDALARQVRGAATALWLAVATIVAIAFGATLDIRDLVVLMAIVGTAAAAVLLLLPRRAPSAADHQSAATATGPHEDHQ